MSTRDLTRRSRQPYTLAHMEPKQRRSPLRTYPRILRRLVLFVVLCLVAHSFDVCAAHTGLPDLHAGTEYAAAQTCHGVNSHGPGNSGSLQICLSCEHPCEPKSHVCNTLSEDAVFNAAPHIYPDYQPVVLSMSFVGPSQVSLPPAFLGTLYGRTGPPPAFLSSSLRASLPNRAPPVSA